MPESSRKREGIKIFKRIRFLTTKHVDTDMCRREGTVCLTRSQLGHLIQVEKPYIVAKMYYIKWPLRLILRNWINRTVCSDKMACWEIIPERYENTVPYTKEVSDLKIYMHIYLYMCIYVHMYTYVHARNHIHTQLH